MPEATASGHVKFYAVWAENPEALDAMIKDYEPLGITIRMPFCGTRRVFTQAPEKSVPCDCGDKFHWLVKYRDA